MNVTVKKSNNTFNFGMAYVPAGYFNTQGGGQGASIVGGQQKVDPAVDHPHGCGDCNNSLSGDGDENTGVVNENYTSNYNTDIDSDVNRAYTTAQPGVNDEV